MLDPLLALAAALAACGDDGTTTAPPADDVPAATFAAPVQLFAAGAPIRTENPGYASPAWHDVDGDGRGDLVVGQFAGGKLRVYRGLEDGTLAAGEWLMAGGDIAEVPGVW